MDYGFGFRVASSVSFASGLTAFSDLGLGLRAVSGLGFWGLLRFIGLRARGCIGCLGFIIGFINSSGFRVYRSKTPQGLGFRVYRF